MLDRRMARSARKTRTKEAPGAAPSLAVVQPGLALSLLDFSPPDSFSECLGMAPTSLHPSSVEVLPSGQMHAAMQSSHSGQELEAHSFQVPPSASHCWAGVRSG